MSFTQDVKREIAAKTVVAPCCVTAACYGVACFAKYFDRRGVVLHTEQAYIAQWAKAMFAEAGVQGKVYVRQNKAHSYEFAVKDPFEVEKLLVLLSHSGSEPTLHIRPENMECESCFAAFLAAAFMCGGMASDPQKGYMLEFVSARYSMMRDFEAMLKQHGYEPGYTERRGTHVLYFKASEQIEDLLTLMGAGKSALAVMNQKVYRDHRNRANRITNCETANIDKTVEANRRVLQAIGRLERAGTLPLLPETLQQTARLRSENPDLSLTELRELFEEPVSKSGLNHRLRKLCEMAERMEHVTKLDADDKAKRAISG